MVWNSLPYNSHHYYYFEVIGCFLAWDAHICLSTLSEQSIETLFLKDALGCSWDARDAQDAFQSDPFKALVFRVSNFCQIFKFYPSCEDIKRVILIYGRGELGEIFEEICTTNFWNKNSMKVKQTYILVLFWYYIY